MGIATHLGPWLLGTVKNTTGSSAGTVRNTGATVCVQSADVAIAAANTICYLPAGSQIIGAMIIVTTGYNAGTGTLSVGGTTYSSALTLPTAAGTASFTVATTGAPLSKNVGTSDVAVTLAISGAASGAGTIVIQYVVRNADGTYQPSTFTA